MSSTIFIVILCNLTSVEETSRKESQIKKMDPFLTPPKCQYFLFFYFLPHNNVTQQNLLSRSQN